VNRWTHTHGMRYHSFRFALPCVGSASLPECVHTSLQEPIAHVQPVLDDVGIPYAYDLVAGDGLYVLLASYILLRSLLKFFLSGREGRGEEEH